MAVKGLGVLCAALCAHCGSTAFGEGAAPDIEQWLAKRADTKAWEELSGKWEASRAAMTAPAENLVLPLDHHENGRVRALLRAEKAQILGTNLVFALNVKVELLQPDGKPDGLLLAEDCLIDRAAKRGFSRGAVDVTQGEDRLKGRGMYFATDDQFIKILSECEIRTFRIPKFRGL